MEQRRYTYGKSVISYLCFGTGKRVVLCFHGYGENAAHFGFLEKYLGPEYRFYAIDLPFHGRTEWNAGLDFSAEDLALIIDGILKEKRGPIILIGFSLGGRAALAYFQTRPSMVSRMVLLAPDGLKVNFWYWLATQTFLGNRLFAFSMRRPGWFFRMLKLINRMGLVNSSVFKFVNFYIGDQEARAVLYRRWTGLRRLRPNLSLVKRLVNQRHIPVRLVYGKYDRIILPVRGEKFRRGIEEFCEINIIPAGHQVLHEKHAEDIAKVLSV